MSAEEEFRASESAAVSNQQFKVNINGKNARDVAAKKSGPFVLGFLFTFLIFGIAFLFFGAGNLIPSAISERLIEETDISYADSVESKILVFQQALKSGEVPEDTANNLADNNVFVGYEEGGSFIRTNQSSGPLSLKFDDKIVSADDFYREANGSVALYDAFSQATYGRAAYYFDSAAMDVFKRIGTTRNNYTAESDFDEVMSKLVGEGSRVEINGVSLVEKTKTEDGEEVTYYEYVGSDEKALSSSQETEDFINTVAKNNKSASKNEAIMSSAESLNIADTVSKEQRSSLFFLAFMENISKMKAGDGGESKINEAMNYLAKETESQVVDVNTGEVVTRTGSMLQSPSLYAILSGEQINADDVRNYASDRVLTTVENTTNIEADKSIIESAVTSTRSKVGGLISKYSTGSEQATYDSLSKITPTIKSSLKENSFSTINGVAAGEFLVEGAVNVGKEIAKASGATAGSSNAAKTYARLNSQILAMDAAADRASRSPFDITSKNTFLGSLVYKFAISMHSSRITSFISSIPNTMTLAVSEILPATYADDNTTGYLSNFGSCKTLESIGAVGSVACSMIATFDTTTLDGIFNNEGFNNFVEQNTTLKDGVRTINKNSALAAFIRHNDNRLTPVGVMDGGILSALSKKVDSIPFLSDAANMIETFFSASDSDKRIASGAAFVNSEDNPDWQVYKYAQRYVSLARATETLKSYSSDNTAYNHLQYFEGAESPVTAFIRAEVAQR